MYQRRLTRGQGVTNSVGEQERQMQLIPTLAPQPSAPQDQRKSTRDRKPPAWMNDFFSKSTKKVPYAFAN